MTSTEIKTKLYIFTDRAILGKAKYEIKHLVQRVWIVSIGNKWTGLLKVFCFVFACIKDTYRCSNPWYSHLVGKFSMGEEGDREYDEEDVDMDVWFDVLRNSWPPSDRPEPGRDVLSKSAPFLLAFQQWSDITMKLIHNWFVQRLADTQMCFND